MAYGKFKMGRGDGRKTIQPVKPKDEAESPRKGDGRMYTGGTPDFDERTGLYRPGSPNEYLNPKPVTGGFVNESGKRKRVTPKPGRGDGRKTIMPVPPRGEKRPISKGKPEPKPLNPRKERQLPGKIKPGANPTKKKTGPRRPNRNDIIRNRLRPVGGK